MTRKDYIWKAMYRDELRRVIAALTKDPTSSETVSSANGGSHSVSYQSLSTLTAELREVEKELADFRSSVRGGPLNLTYPRWCNLGGLS